MASVARVLELEDRSPTPIFELPLPEPALTGNRRFLPRLRRPFAVRPLGSTSTLEGLDISFGGIMCTGNELIWPGNTVEMDLVLPGEAKPVRITGRIADIVPHLGRTAMRVRFENVSVERRKRIALWMSRQAAV